ncbi:unnamed protein product [Sphacelaria rigidula]
MQIIPKWARCDVEEMVELACRVNVNAHGLRDDSGSNFVVGVGMFPLAAMINHSCRPNCTFTYHGEKMMVRTLEPVKAGTELTVYYIDLLQSTADRQRMLLESKHFLCCCPRCETRGLADVYLDGVCCLDCGQDGCLAATPPPTQEEDIAAQLMLLGQDSTDTGTKKSGGKGSGGKGKKKANRGSGSSAASGGEDTASRSSSKPAQGGCNGAAIGINSRNGTTGNMFYCSSCGREYQRTAVEEGVARAKAAWDAAMAVLRAKDFPGARKKLEKWLEDYDAGSAPPTATYKKSMAKKGKLKLHPMHATVVQTLVPTANCCNYEEDFSGSARYLRRAITAMEAVYPRNFPELGDFYAALGEALTALLDKRAQLLPRKTRDQVSSERKAALSRATEIRCVCLGEDHPTTKEARRAMAKG